MVKLNLLESMFTFTFLYNIMSMSGSVISSWVILSEHLYQTKPTAIQFTQRWNSLYPKSLFILGRFLVMVLVMVTMEMLTSCLSEDSKSNFKAIFNFGEWWLKFWQADFGLHSRHSQCLLAWSISRNHLVVLLMEDS